MKEERNERESDRGFSFSAFTFATVGVEVEVEFFFFHCFRLSTSSSVEERGKESAVEKKKNAPSRHQNSFFSSLSLIEPLEWNVAIVRAGEKGEKETTGCGGIAMTSQRKNDGRKKNVVAARTAKQKTLPLPEPPKTRLTFPRLLLSIYDSTTRLAR